MKQTSWAIKLNGSLYVFFLPRSKTKEDCWWWFGGYETFWALNRKQLEAKGFTCEEVNFADINSKIQS